MVRHLAPRRWLRLPRRTARLRLTLLYSGMFLALGTALIVVIYVLGASGGTVSVAEPLRSSRSHALAAPAAPQAPGAPGVLHVTPSMRLVLPGVRDAVVQQKSADQGNLLGASWVVLVITALMSAILGWFLAGRVLRPLRVMTATAETISAGNLGERLALSGPKDEFKRLGDTFDDLLDRLQASFEAQRRFVANASHELRTPLTVERTLLQVALSDPRASVESLRATCEELLTAGREHERLLDALLTLASSERGLDHREPVDLAVLADRAVTAAEPEIGRRGLTPSTGLGPATAAGDPALLARLIGNLVENAVRYNVPAGWVHVSTAAREGEAVVTVSNSGPVVPPEEVERLFEPFARGGRARAGDANGHHGLGLSIVRAIATAHGGTVAASPRSAGGLTVTVSLPVVAAADVTSVLSAVRHPETG